MARTQYETKKIGPAKMEAIEWANRVCKEYAEAGIPLTLRQLFYQGVARGLIANKQTEYDRLGDVCRDARMAGLMDWDHLIDLTRNIRPVSSWKGPEHMLERSAASYHRDLWKPQWVRPEVWIEKDAAIGVVQGVCEANSVPYFSCRGYTSMSEMHEAAQRVRFSIERGDRVQILHIGDHDPSGLDMSRDIEDRLRQFISRDWAGLHMGSGAWTRGQIRQSMQRHMQEVAEKAEAPDWVFDDIANNPPWSVKRIALNLDQIEQYDPPPNPAKRTDGRFQRYYEETGLEESWELDALAPDVMADLIQTEVDSLRSEDVWAESEREMEREREILKALGDNYEAVEAFVRDLTTNGATP